MNLMFCTSCGKQLEDGTKFCIYCGATQDLAPASAPAAEPASPASEPTVSFESAPSFEPAPAFESAPVESAPKKGSSGKKIAVIAVVGVLVLALLGLNAYQYFFIGADAKDEIADLKSDLKKTEAKYNDLQDEYDELEALYDSADTASSDLWDICYYADYDNIGYSSDTFHADKAIIVLSEDDYYAGITLTVAFDQAATVSLSVDGSSADVNFDEDTWEGDTTTLSVEPLERGVTLATFTNDINSESFSVIIIVTE